MIVHEKNGGRTIFLYLPFDYRGRQVESITLSPFKFGHTLAWNDGKYRTMLDLLLEFTGVEESLIREFREDITNGVIPQSREEPPPRQRPPQQQQPQEEYRPNGGGPPMAMMGPGDPLPLDEQPGFDMSDEAP
jgi:hypothetical protein